jgi:hypothetical protein
MTILTDYAQFDGRHYETGSLHNLLSYQGHTISEALLLAISGGAAVGYFSFDYAGHDPHVALLTRNTFDPFDRLCERLGLIQDAQRTASADKATAHLNDALANGQPALVWADVSTLPYNIVEAGYWSMQPIVVYGADAESVYLADRAAVPLTFDAATFSTARGRVKKERHLLMTVTLPDDARIPAAVRAGLEQSAALFLDGPPVAKAANSYGQKALLRLADVLTQRKDKQSWQKIFPRGRALLSGLATLFTSIEGMTFNTAPGAERAIFAAALDEAAALLDRPALNDVAERFRANAPVWTALAEAALPADAPALAEMRDLLRREQALFIEQGAESTDERRAIHERLDALRTMADADFPLDEAATADLLADLRERVLDLHARETDAFKALRAAL